MCGPGKPLLGEKIIVFTCGKNKNKNENFRLHDFTSFTGFVRWNEENEDLVRGLVGAAGEICRDTAFSERCVRRDLGICGKIRKELVPLRSVVYESVEVAEPVKQTFLATGFNVGVDGQSFNSSFLSFLNRRRNYLK